MAPLATLPSSDFLEYLRLQGFEIGIDHYRRLHILLSQVGADFEPRRLKTCLCPLFATSSEQQQAFYEAFDRFHESWSSSAELTGPELEATPAAAPISSRRRPRGWGENAQIRLAILSLVAAVVLALIWSSSRVRQRAPPAESANAAPVGTPRTSPTPHAPPSSPAGSPSAPTRGGWPAVRLGRWVGTMRWALIIAPLALFAVAEIVRRRRRKLILRRVRAPRPPFAWPIRVPTRSNPYALSAELREATLALRERESTAVERLAMEPSIKATIAARGYPTLRYTRDTRLAEYLFLIERSSYRDHQTRLFSDLAETLWREGVHVTAYLYDGDPRICHPLGGGEPVLLANLRRSHPAHRLIVFGSGERLIDPLNGLLADWTELFCSWTDRAVLTPEPPERWSVRERALATEFIVLPATIVGLRTAVALFRTPANPDLGRPLDNGNVAPTLERAIALEQLRAYLGPQLFRWLCACAVYPELHWDLTLYLATLPSLGEGLVGEDYLLRLVRLPWFRAGSIPDEIRTLLVDQLDPREMVSVREALVGLLERQAVPADSVAADRRGLDLAVQRYAIAPKLRSTRHELRRALERLTRKGEITDHAIVQLLDKVPQSHLIMLLPIRLRPLLFRAGVPALGWSTAFRLALAVASASALAALVMPRRSAPVALRHPAAAPVIASRPIKAQPPPAQPPAVLPENAGSHAAAGQRVDVNTAAHRRARASTLSRGSDTLRRTSVARVSSPSDSNSQLGDSGAASSVPSASVAEAPTVVTPSAAPVASKDSTAPISRDTSTRDVASRDSSHGTDSAAVAAEAARANDAAQGHIRMGVTDYVEALRSRNLARVATLYQSQSASDERTRKRLIDVLKDQASRLAVIDQKIDSMAVGGSGGSAEFEAKLTWRTAFGAFRTEWVSFHADFRSSNGRFEMTSCKITRGLR